MHLFAGTEVALFDPLFFVVSVESFSGGVVILCLVYKNKSDCKKKREKEEEKEGGNVSEPLVGLK